MTAKQERFFKHLAMLQKSCVGACMARHGTYDEQTKSMLYEVTYEMTVGIMETIDGYSDFSHDRHDIVNTVTQERLKAEPFIELHDAVEEWLVTDSAG
jgi:hypothetical protein